MKIIDFSTDYAGRYASRILAEQGHEVIAVQLHNGGVPIGQQVPTLDLHPLAFHLDRAKSVLTADTASIGAGAVAEAATDADVVIHCFAERDADRHGLSLEALRELAPRALVVTVTPFGYASARMATEKTLQAAGGAMLISGGAEALRDGRPPLDINLPLIGTLGAIHVAIGILALALGNRNAANPPRHLDVALRDLVPASLEKLTASFAYLGTTNFRGTRGGRLDATAGLGDMPAKDGYFHIFVLREAFRKLAELIGRDDLAADPDWSDPRRRTYTPEQTTAIVAEAVAELTLDELSARAARLQIPSGPIVEIDRLVDRPQLQARGAIRNTAAGLHIEEPYRIAPGKPSGGRSPDRRRSASEGGVGPLAGIRVLDLTQAYAGPSATRLLAELGAEVIKIESVSRLDIYPRTLVPFRNATEGDFWERSAYFAERNFGKKGITLDLADPEGRAIFASLVPHADVVASNYTPRVMRKWGFGPAALLELNPQLIVLSMSGFGGEGPDAEMPALAGLIEAASGFTAQVRYRDDEAPVDVGFSFGDMVSGLYASLATLIALEQRDRDGLGRAIDLSCAEAPLPFLAAKLVSWQNDGRRPSVETELVPNGRHLFVRTDDGPERWIIAFEPSVRQGAIAATLECEDADGGRAVLRSRLGQAEACARLEGAGFAASVLADAEQLHFDSVLKDRQLFEIVTRADVETCPHARAVSALLDGKPLGSLSPPPLLGEDTAAILGNILGLSAGDVDALEQRGLTGRRPVGPIPSILRVPLPLAELEAAGRLRRHSDAAERLASHFGYEARDASAIACANT